MFNRRFASSSEETSVGIEEGVECGAPLGRPLSKEEGTVNLSFSFLLRRDFHFVTHPLLPRQADRSGREFLVLWDGYPSWEASWEAEDQITQLAIDEYFSPVVPEPTVACQAEALLGKICEALKSPQRSTVTSPMRRDFFYCVW